MYILFYRQRFEFKSLFTTRFWLRLITKRASQSKYHHVDHTLPYDKVIISQAHNPVYRHIFFLDYFKEMGNVDVYAYKVIKKVDEEALRKTEKYLVGKKYGTRGAISSESHGLVKEDPNDPEVHCSESEVITYERQTGWINKVANKNEYSPQECLELIIDRKIVKDILIKVWDSKKQKIINNIFDDDYKN